MEEKIIVCTRVIDWTYLSFPSCLIYFIRRYFLIWTSCTIKDLIIYIVQMSLLQSLNWNLFCTQKFNSFPSTKVNVFWKRYGGQIFKVFPSKRLASDWLTELVDQSAAKFLAGKSLNICPPCPFQKTATLSTTEWLEKFAFLDHHKNRW